VEKFISPSISFVNFDDNYAKKVVGDKIVKVGIDGDYPITAKNITQENEYQYFSVYYYGKRLGRIKTRLKGKHNIYNCLFAISVALELKIPFCFIKRGIEEFKGVSRRDEYIGDTNGKKVFIDYAHHPKELESLIGSISESENTILVFQPHTYSRTKFLMADFIRVLSNSKGEVVIYKTYPAREKYDRNSSALALYRKLSKVKNAKYFKSKKGLIDYLKKEEKGKNIYLVGAGDVYEIAKILTTRKKLEKSAKKLLQKN
jgi:UDP-N-acetylmuramate--alanine ligase